MHRLLKILFFFLLPLQLFAEKESDIIGYNDSVAKARAFDYFYIQALSLREAEKYDEAFDLFEHCLSLQPSSPIVQYELYSMYNFLGRSDEALRMIEQASAGDPGNFWYRSLLAMAYEEAGNREKAKEVYEEMSEDFSSHSELFYVLYQIYADDKDYEKAIGALSEIERIDGKNEQITLYTLMNKYELAIKEVQELVDEYPDEPRLRLYLASVYEMIGYNEQAVAIYKDVLVADPDNLEAQVSLAEYYNNADSLSLYTKTVEKILMNSRFTGEKRTNLLVRHIAWKEQTDTTGYNERLLKNLMQLPFDKVPTAEIYVDYLRLKEVGNDTIAPLLEYILTIEPENQKAQLGLLQIAIDRNDYKEVITRCDTAILYNPEILELYFYKGIACYQEERLQEAIEAYKNGLERRAEDYDGELVSNVYTLLGDTYHEVGNLDACMQAYDSALVYNSENVAVLNNYAYYLSMEGGDLDKAEEMSLITIKSEPENATYIDTYMWILFCKERYQEAKAYADKLLAITKEDADKVLLHHCGDVYAKCGDIERAVELWQRAQSAGDDSKLLTKKIKKRKYYADKKKK